MTNVAVIGAGNMGRHHVRIYSEMPNVRLCAVADLDEPRAQSIAARYGGNAYGDYRAMLAREKLDAISIVVPTHEHFHVAAEVIRAGVSLLVEKPLAANSAQAQELVALAHAAKVKLAVGHIERFNPVVQALKRRVDAGALGAISAVVAKRVGVMPPQAKDANVVIDLAVHDIDLLNYFFDGLPDHISASAGSALLSDRLDHAEIFLRYGSAGCFVLVNWITPLKVRTLSITGDAGHAELNYVTQRLEMYATNAAREYDNFGDFVVRFGEAEKVAVPVEMREPLRLELDGFVRTVQGLDEAIVSGEDGVRALQVAEWAIRQASMQPQVQRIARNDR